MPLTLPRSVFAGDRADAAAAKAALPAALQRATPLLPALRVKAQLSSCMSVTWAFVAKTLPKPKPLALPVPEQAPEQAGGDAKVVELVVIAVRRVVRVDTPRRASSAGRGRAAGSWARSFRSRDQRRVQCSLRYGDARKLSRVAAAAETAASAVDVDEKFAFGRREGAPLCQSAVIELLAPRATAAERAAPLGSLVVDVAREFLAAEGDSSAPPEPIHRSGVLVAPDGAASAAWEVDYVLHRLPVETEAAQAAAATLARSARSVDDSGDLEAFGAAFPRLWYMF